MSIEELGKQLKFLQDELSCLHAAEQHIQEKIDILLEDLNQQLNAPKPKRVNSDLSKLPKTLRKFETEHPALTDSINRVMVTLGNMGI